MEYKYLESIKWKKEIKEEENKTPLSDIWMWVYSVSRTGSCTLYHTLAKYLPEAGIVFHGHHQPSIHFLCGGEKYKGKEIMKDVVEYNRRRGREIYLVTSFRDPIERLFSIVAKTSIERKNMEDIKEIYNLCVDRIYCESIWHSATNIIFSPEEIDRLFLEKYKYDRQKKYSIIEEPGWKYLILTLDYNEVWCSAISEFLGGKDIKELQVAPPGLPPHVAVYKKLRKEIGEKIKLKRCDIEYLYYGEHKMNEVLNWYYDDGEISRLYYRALEKYGE